MRRGACIALILCAVFSGRAMQSRSVTESDSPLADIPVAVPQLSVPDSLAPVGGTYAERNWFYLLKHKKLDPKDPTVIWPNGFVSWCMGVYDWFERNLNDRDTAYVSKNVRMGKVMLTSDNWVDMYRFGSSEIPRISMLGNLYPNLGIQVKYGVFSLGYSIDMSTVFGWKNSDHRKFDFGVSCAKFNLEMHYWRNNGTTYIFKFGDYKENNKLYHYGYEGLDFKAANLHGYYLFNSRKFDQGAALSYENNQRVSAGSAVLGLDFSWYVATFDFTLLPGVLQDYQEYPLDSYRFNYQTFTVIGGYSFNWVWNKHFVYNITCLPGVGITSSKVDSSYGRDTLAAFNVKGSMGLLYSYKRLFVGATASVMCNAFLSKKIDFLNSRQNYRLSVGMKF